MHKNIVKAQKGLGLILILVLCFACTGGNKKLGLTEVKDVDHSEIKVYDFEGLEPMLYTEESKTYIVNFWAMWCAPCVKEMPYLQEYANNHPEVELVFVSMDFPDDIETKLKPFLEKNKIMSRVVLLDDPDSNTWIDKVNPNWSGAIPYTLVFNNQKRAYFERSFDDLADFETAMNNFNLK